MVTCVPIILMYTALKVSAMPIIYRACVLFVGGMFGRLIMVCGQKYDVGGNEGVGIYGSGP